MAGIHKLILTQNIASLSFVASICGAMVLICRKPHNEIRGLAPHLRFQPTNSLKSEATSRR